MSAFEKLYDRMFSALKAYPGLVDVGSGGDVPVANVHPSDDPLEVVAGSSIIYSMTASSEDLKFRRFEGVMQVTVGNPKSKMAAHLTMAKVRRALVPIPLTGDGILVMLFKEQSQATDAGKAEESWRVTTAFSFKMVEGSL
jgi:hypothetical protein